MHVDQTRHQRSPAAVDHLRAVGLDLALGYFLDEIAFHQHAHALGKLVTLAVKDVDVGEENLRFGLLFLRYGCGCKREGGGQTYRQQTFLDEHWIERSGTNSYPAARRTDRAKSHRYQKSRMSRA